MTIYTPKLFDQSPIRITSLHAENNSGITLNLLLKFS